MPFSRWEYPEFSKEESRRIREEYGVSSMISDILAARKLSNSEIDNILNDGEFFADPFLLPDMQKAVERINKALEQNEKIAVYGDYDCDGVTATAIVVQFLQSMGADVFYYIPERQGEGYGLNCEAIDVIIEKGATLIVTVDNGISAIDEINYSNSKGVDVVVTDHHQVGETLPDAVAVVNPHRSEYNGFKDLCGAGVALKLCAALEGDIYTAVENFSVLAMIGTVGDVMPLNGENRFIVKKGLDQLGFTENIGIQALISVSGVDVSDITAQKIAFSLVPRINAAGRMGSANSAEELLLCEDEERAFEIAEEINSLNADRRAGEEEILTKLYKELESNPSLVFDRVLMVSADNLHQGVVGIVASRLSNLYGKPCIVLSKEGEQAVGSARSFGEFSLYDALSSCEDILIKYGGHKSAAGMTVDIKNLDIFKTRLNSYAENNYDVMPCLARVIDKELHISDINVAMVEELSLLEPCGEENLRPLFLLKNCVIEQIIPLANDKHLKIKVNFEGKSIYVLYFRMSTDNFIYSVGNRIDILANLEINTYKETVSIAVKLCDIRPSGIDFDKIINASHYYEKIRRGEEVDKRIMEIAVPDTDELRTAYKIFRQLENRKLHLDDIYLLGFSGKINYCKFRLMTDILSELKLITVAKDFSNVKLEESKKVNLESSQILCDLKGE